METNSGIMEYYLNRYEVDELCALVTSLRKMDGSPSAAEFYDHQWTMVDRLPIGLRRFLERVRRQQSAAGGLIHGFPVNDSEIGATPPHWSMPTSHRTLDHEFFLGLCGMALGEPFTWATLQSGKIVQNILPIAGDEDCQNGYGSDALLEFHTEDGFHPDRCDYLLLYGLRNRDEVPTTLASIRDTRLSAAERAVLTEKRFYIVPDDEHIRQLQERSPDNPALREAIRMRDDPEQVALLFGDVTNPWMRVDRPFTSCLSDDSEAEAALNALMVELERVQQDIVISPGSLLIVDNYVAVHGRKSFRSRYDGTDRWLKKMTVRGDLRRLVTATGTVNHRVLI